MRVAERRVSAMGHEQTSHRVRVMSVIPLKADIYQHGLHVRFVPEADIDTSQIPLRFDLHQPLTTANEISSLER